MEKVLYDLKEILETARFRARNVAIFHTWQYIHEDETPPPGTLIAML